VEHMSIANVCFIESKVQRMNRREVQQPQTKLGPWILEPSAAALALIDGGRVIMST
jgi:hypothetical protein